MSSGHIDPSSSNQSTKISTVEAALRVKKTDPRAMRKALLSRRLGLAKKAAELSTLCEAEVCLLCCSGDDGTIMVVPEDFDAAMGIIDKYSHLSYLKKVAEALGPENYDKDGKLLKKDDSRKTSEELAGETPPAANTTASCLWPPELDTCTPETLQALLLHIQSRIASAEQDSTPMAAETETLETLELLPIAEITTHQTMDFLATGSSVLTELDDTNAEGGIDVDLSIGWPHNL